MLTTSCRNICQRRRLARECLRRRAMLSRRPYRITYSKRKYVPHPGEHPSERTNTVPCLMRMALAWATPGLPPRWFSLSRLVQIPEEKALPRGCLSRRLGALYISTFCKRRGLIRLVCQSPEPRGEIAARCRPSLAGISLAMQGSFNSRLRSRPAEP